MTLLLADRIATGPTLGDVRTRLHNACRLSYAQRSASFYLDLFTDDCAIPAAYLDAWLPSAARWYGPGGLDNYTAEENPDDGLTVYLSLLLAWLQMAADSKDTAPTMTVADATGWQLVLAGAWANDERVQMPDLVHPWSGMTSHAWAYAAAGFTPADIQAAGPEVLPDADGLRVLAALRGVVLPNPLPDLTRP